MEQRTFYKPAMKLGKQFQVYIPLGIIEGLNIEDRDELEITIRKTGKSIEKRKKSPLRPFGHFREIMENPQ